MKLPIKKKYFDMIKNGEKEIEWRDAHITFVCEETGRKLKKDIVNIWLSEKKHIRNLPKDVKFDDDLIIEFQLS